jgi:uncharacterized protein (TIGR00369 family)
VIGVDDRVAMLNDFGRDRVPGMWGLEITSVGPDGAEGGLTVTPPLMSGTGYVWAPVVVGLADILCAYAMDLPEGTSFTTIEIKTNFLASATVGERIVGRSWPVHRGRTTQVWDAQVTNETTGKTMALFRNTQLILPPRR